MDKKRFIIFFVILFLILAFIGANAPLESTDTSSLVPLISQVIVALVGSSILGTCIVGLSTIGIPIALGWILFGRGGALRVALSIIWKILGVLTISAITLAIVIIPFGGTAIFFHDFISGNVTDKTWVAGALAGLATFILVRGGLKIILGALTSQGVITIVETAEKD